MKKYIFFLLIALMVSSRVMSDAILLDSLYYQFNDDTNTAIVVAGDNRYSGTIVIPTNVTYNEKQYNVTSIGDNAFNLCQDLNSVTIGNNVTSIGWAAFYACTSLTSISIPNSVTSIAKQAFGLCSKVTSLTIGNSVTNIGDYAFYGCTGLTSVTIPNSVISIGKNIFQDCSSLRSVTISDNVTSIGDWAFSGCTGLTSLTIPNSVTSIEKGAFYSCSSLTSVTIGDGITSIGNLAFSQCTGLTSVTIGNSVTSIGQYAFAGCTGLTSVVWNAKNGPSYNFGNQVTSFTFGNEVEIIPAELCKGMTKLTAITISNSITSIGDKAFGDCTGLTSVNIGNSVTSIGSYAFGNCSGLTSVTIPNSVTSIGASAFRFCTGLTSVTIGNSVTSIGDWVFSGCSGLTSITIPNSVTSIGDRAFYQCRGLTSVTIEVQTPPTLGIKVFESCPAAIYVPCSTLETYKTAWTDYGSLIKYAPLSYKISTLAENGNIQVSSKENYTICDELPYYYTLTVVTNYGYHFTQWSDGNTNNPRTIVLTQDTTFTAEFEKNSYTISTTSANPEWGTTIGDTMALYLEKVEISAIPNYGYHFVRWNDNNTSNPRTVSVTEDKTYTATFAKNVYSITKNAEHGTISGNSSAEYLDEVTLSVSSDYGYHFAQWSDGNTNNPRTIVLSQDTTFTAEFAIDKSGTCGENNVLMWTYDDLSQTLTISGSGALTANYTYGAEAPTQMKTLIIGNEVTAIGDSAFYKTSSINHLIIGGSVASIGDYAFAECRNFDDITCYAQDVPAINANTFANVGNKQYIYLYVPEDRERAYKRDTYWGEFDVQVKGASETTTDKNVTVTPNENSAIVTWPTSNNAATYTLQITKDGVVFCTLIFNGAGQLIGIAFAPSRDGSSHAPAATVSVAGMSFTVTGLSSASKYAYNLSVADDNNQEIVYYQGEFATTGYEGEVVPGGEPVTPGGGTTAIDNVNSATQSVGTIKFFRNGQLFIQRGNELFNAQGARVK